MYIVSGGVRRGDKRLAIAAGDKNFTNSKNQELHDIKVAEFNPLDRSQKWWHGSDMALHSYAPYHDMVLIERNGTSMMLEHEESFETHHGKFVSNKMAYNVHEKHWYNEVTGNIISIDVSDPFKVP